VGKSVERGTGNEAKDDIIGRGGIISDKVIGFNGVGVRGNDTEMIFSHEEVVSVEIGMGIGRGAKVGMDVTNVGVEMHVDEFLDVGNVPKGIGVMVDEDDKVVEETGLLSPTWIVFM
ncbi:hypothetical protein KI387_039893, partial [Taxus chinensis]